MTISRARRWGAWGHLFSPESQRKTVRGEVAPGRPVNRPMARLTASASSPADMSCWAIQAAKRRFPYSATTARYGEWTTAGR
ncbi:hypothetical protein CH313_27885 [Streptomyces sp. TSRI0384-2]|nr:hypothetical protein CH313_27885 [Streptomyces sp. TSRI0384-2]